MRSRDVWRNRDRESRWCDRGPCPCVTFAHAAARIGRCRANRETDERGTLDDRFLTTLDAARAGSEQAWAAIYREHAPGVLRFLRGRGAHDPEEVLGAVSLDVVRSVARFEGGNGDFRAWVFSIAHRRLVDDYRRRGRRQDDPMTPESLRDLAPCGDAEEDAALLLAREDAARMLCALTPDQRDVLLLRILAGLSIAETASVLGKREGAVEVAADQGSSHPREPAHGRGRILGAAQSISEER